MTKQKLLELCDKLIKKEITKDTIYKLKELTDTEIDIVLNSTNKDVLIRLLSNENFRNLLPETKSQIINILNQCEDQFGKVEHIINVATNQNAISSNLVVELVTLISKAKGISQSYISSLVACNFNSIASGEVLSLVKMLSNCLDEEILNVAYHASINPYTTISGRLSNMVELICNAKSKEEALEIYYRALNLSIDINPLKALEDGRTKAIDFWQMFSESGAEAISLLDNFQLEEELSPKMIITSDAVTNKKRK